MSKSMAEYDPPQTIDVLRKMARDYRRAARTIERAADILDEKRPVLRRGEAGPIVLEFLRSNGPASWTEIARQTKVSSWTVSKQLRAMKGKVQKGKGKNGLWSIVQNGQDSR